MTEPQEPKADSGGFHPLRSGSEVRLEQEAQAHQARALYRDHVAGLLRTIDLAVVDPVALADKVVDHLSAVMLADGGEVCPCQHDMQRCQAEMRAQRAELAAFLDSPRGRDILAADEAEMADLAAWLDGQPDVMMTRRAKFAPEQWDGVVDGHSFFFHERHGRWRIELGLRPSGHYTQIWTVGDIEDPSSYKLVEIEDGNVIAEGPITVDGYGTTPVERAELIVGIIRDHIGRHTCEVHTPGVPLETTRGFRCRWCPGCGERLIG